MNVYVAQSEFGRGLFAARDFAAGEFILEYQGRIIRSDEAHRNAAGYPLQISEHTYIDLETPGMFTNHSCEPNAGVKYDSHLVALCPIQCGEEIRIDYSTTMWEDHWTMRCCCEAASCRKIVQGFYLLPEELQQHYLRLNIVQSFIVRRLQAGITQTPFL
jgi:hypothetical protein